MEDPFYSLYAFIDESGDPSLETSLEGVTAFYSVCAVLLPGQALTDSESQAEMVRKHFFQTGEMKSSLVGSNIERRKAILRALSKTKIKCYSLVVDKRLILRGSGLTYKRSFIKYIHGRLLKVLFRALDSISVTADRHGSQQFMDGFEKYVQSRHVPSLFTSAKFSFAESALTPLIQVADFIGGSLRIAMTSPAEERKKILECLAPVSIGIEDWPPARLLGGLTEEPAPTGYDDLIKEQSIRQASIFIMENAESTDPDIALQVEVLLYLLYHFNAVSSSTYVSTDEMLSMIRESDGSPVTMHRFRLKVIGRLRDEGVIIASSSRGYKIPSSVHDLYDFVNHANSILVPMLSRLEMARRSILIASNGACDILGRAEYEHIRMLVESKPN